MVENKVTYFHKLFGNNDQFDKVLNTLTPSEIEIISRYEIIEVCFYETNPDNWYAVALFVNGELKYKAFRNRVMDRAGKRSTERLIDLPDNLYQSFLIHFNKYFSKSKVKGNQSQYKRQFDFIYDIFPINYGLKAQKLSKFSEIQLNINDVNQDIPKYLLDLFKSQEEVPFHQIRISFYDIQLAINKLSEDYHNILNVWFFPEAAPKNKRAFNRARYHKLFSNEADAQKSLRLKNNALKALIENIQNIQNELEKTLH